MLYIDDELWPLAICILEDTQSIDEHIQMLEAWNNWFTRDDNFIAVRIYRNETSLAQVDDIARTTKQWLKNGAADQIRQKIKAMLNIVPPAKYEQMKLLSVEKVFGIPGGIFSDLDSSFEWLEKYNHYSAGPDIIARVKQMSKQ